MSLGPKTFVALSCLYWAATLGLAFLAIGAPCGFAPGLECDLQPPPMLWRTLGLIGPLGVMLLGLVIYLGAVWLNGRDKKVR